MGVDVAGATVNLSARRERNSSSTNNGVKIDEPFVTAFCGGAPGTSADIEGLRRAGKDGREGRVLPGIGSVNMGRT